MNTSSSSSLSASALLLPLFLHVSARPFSSSVFLCALAGVHATVLRLSRISALSPPSLQLSLLLPSPCPTIWWSCPDYSTERGCSSSPRPSLPPWLGPLIYLEILQTQSHHLSISCTLCFLPSPIFPFPQPCSAPFIRFLPCYLHLFTKPIHSFITHLSTHPFSHSSSQLLFLLTSPHPTAARSKCREDSAWAKISSPRRSVSMYQLIGINLHPGILLLLLCFSSLLQAPFCFILLLL